MKERRAVIAVDSLDDLAPRPRIVTIGTFDGVHLGHRFLLSSAVARGRERDLPTAVVTFEPIPAQVLRPDRFPGRICSPEDKLDQLAESGVDEVVVLTFDLELAALSPEAFMSRLVEATHLRELWVGEAFALGKDRVGDVARLRQIGHDLGFTVSAVSRIADGESVISSSAIRTAVHGGDVERAWRSLGRPFRVTGEVIHGAHFGRTIGYPTANVVPPEGQVLLADGIYVSLATLSNTAPPRRAMTYVGTRPAVNTGDRLVETHILDFAGDLYGHVIHVDVLNRLRGDATFDSIDGLVEQLHKDEAATRAYFARYPNGRQQGQ